MKKLAAQMLLAGAAIVSAGMVFGEAGKKPAVEPAKTQAKKTFDTINQAYEKADINTLLSNIASDATLTLIGVNDGSFYAGYENVKNALKKAVEIRSAYKCKTAGQIIKLNNASDVAWIAQKNDCTFTTAEKTTNVTIRSTAVEVKKGAKWLLIQSHDSIGTP
ncbi:MAG: nuclear transport factor 2 family protein [Nitrospirota bacterium]